MRYRRDVRERNNSTAMSSNSFSTITDSKDTLSTRCLLNQDFDNCCSVNNLSASKTSSLCAISPRVRKISFKSDQQDNYSNDSEEVLNYTNAAPAEPKERKSSLRRKWSTRSNRVTLPLSADTKFKLIIRQNKPELTVSFEVVHLGPDYLLAVGKTEEMVAEKVSPDSKFRKKYSCRHDSSTLSKTNPW